VRGHGHPICSVSGPRLGAKARSAGRFAFRLLPHPVAAYPVVGYGFRQPPGGLV